jgi:SPP1 gp7 family putative phage head morphogenesis protein
MPANPISRRLASRLHVSQIETLRRANGVTNAIDRTTNAAVSKIMAAVSDSATGPLGLPLGPIRRAIEPLWREIAQTILEQLRAMAEYANKQSVKVLLDTVPRKWWRLRIPTLPIAESQIAVLEARRRAGLFGSDRFWSLDEIFEAVVPDPLGGQIPPVPPIVLGTPAPGDDPFRFGRQRIVLGPGVTADIEDEPVRRGGLSKAEFDKLMKELIFPPPSRERIDGWVFSTDWAQRLTSLSRQIADPQRLATEIAVGYAQGENIAQLTKRVRDTAGVASASAKRIARTEAMRVAGNAQNESFTALGPLQIGLQHNAQIDQNSRPEHAALNGKIYYNDPEPGQSSVNEMVIEPGQARLPNCRCWSSPVLREPEEVRNDPAVRAEFENASGAEIPDPTAYDRWFAQADVPTRKEAVGPNRYGLAKEVLGREPDWVDLIDKDGSLLSLKQIETTPQDERFQRRAEVYAMFRRREDLFRQVSQRGFVFSR